MSIESIPANLLHLWTFHLGVTPALKIPLLEQRCTTAKSLAWCTQWWKETPEISPDDSIASMYSATRFCLQLDHLNVNFESQRLSRRCLSGSKRLRVSAVRAVQLAACVICERYVQIEFNEWNEHDCNKPDIQHVSQAKIRTG